MQQRMAILIWAAVLVIAAQIFAGSAFAHNGHLRDHGAANHHPATYLSAARDPAIHGIAVENSSPDHAWHDVRSPKKDYAAQSQSADVILTAADSSESPLDTASSGCRAGCCGTGIGCCGAFLADASNAFPDFEPAKKIISFVFEYSSGIDPEALMRPPRTLV